MRGSGADPRRPSPRTAAGSAPGGARIALVWHSVRSVRRTPAPPGSPGWGLPLRTHTAWPTPLAVSLPRTGGQGKAQGPCVSAAPHPPPPQAPWGPAHAPRDRPRADSSPGSREVPGTARRHGLTRSSTGTAGCRTARPAPSCATGSSERQRQTLGEGGAPHSTAHNHP